MICDLVCFVVVVLAIVLFDFCWLVAAVCLVSFVLVFFVFFMDWLRLLSWLLLACLLLVIM